MPDEFEYHGAEGRPVPAFLVHPAGTPRAGIVFQHEASANKMSFFEEAQEWAARGFLCLLPDGSWVRSGAGAERQNTSSPATLTGFLSRICDDLVAGIAALRTAGGADLPVAFVGRNLGGALSGEVARRADTLSAVVGLACLPRMSQFWQHADHPVALRQRGQSDSEAYRRAWAAAEDMDLWESAARTRCPKLYQFGRRDDWVPMEDVEAFSHHIGKKCDISLFDDDHAFGGMEARTERIEWVLTKLEAEEKP